MAYKYDDDAHAVKEELQLMRQRILEMLIVQRATLDRDNPESLIRGYGDMIDMMGILGQGLDHILNRHLHTLPELQDVGVEMLVISEN